jgi:hypothetical protein
MLRILSAIIPRPIQRCIPRKPLYRQRRRPCRRLATLIRPSHSVRHFWPSRNQRFFCSRLRSTLLAERFGMQTRLTPLAFCCRLVLGRVESGVRSQQPRDARQLGAMAVEGWDQQVAIIGAPSVHFVVDDDLIFRFLQLEHLACCRSDGLIFASAWHPPASGGRSPRPCPVLFARSGRESA